MPTIQDEQAGAAVDRAAATRLTREQSQEATRERLLAAARTVFARAGYHGASVDEIASEAGFSTGALYSNFDGKVGLFLDLMEREVARHAEEVAEAVRDRGTVSARAAGGAEQWMKIVDREPELVLLFMEFWAYGVRDRRVRARVAERFAQVRELLSSLIADSAQEFDLALAMPAEHLAVAIDALADGIARQKLVDPGAVPDGLLGQAIAMLLSGASHPAPSA
ncbi:MAG: TetR/AcrR family transcriptional regulator [Acidobacteriota bacterium]|nr:TetR/AcrR family transcriptional regulator [Acidobacteriota bacterium]